MKKFAKSVLPPFIVEKIEGRIYLQKVLENIAWLFIEKIMRVAVGLFVSVWVARYLGPEQFGILGYALAIVAVLAIFASLGMDGIVVRDIVNDPDCARETLGSAFVMKLAGGVLTTVLGLSLMYLLRTDDTLTIYMVGVIALSTIFQAFSTIGLWFQSRVESKYAVYAQNFAFLTVSAIKVFLIISRAPLIAFAWMTPVEAVIVAVGLVYYFRVKGNYMRQWQVSFSKIKYLLSKSWPLILSGLTISIYMKIDQIMLGQMMGNHAVGIYTSAVRLAEFWYFIPAVMVSSLTPAILEARKIDQKLYYYRLQQLFNILAVMAYALAIPTTFISNWIIVALYGAEYSQAGLILAIYIWAAVFIFLGNVRGIWVVAEDLMKFSMVTSIIGLVINVALNFYLIPGYGPVGAAIATVISQMLISVGSSFFYSKTIFIGKMQMKALLLVGLLNRRRDGSLVK